MYTINVNFQSAGSTGFVAHLPKKLKTSGIEQLHTFRFNKHLWNSDTIIILLYREVRQTQ